MGVSTYGSSAATEPISSAFQPEPQELLHLRATVHPDGADARFTIHTTKGQICLTAPLDQIAAAHAEIGSASALMRYRTTMKKDCGEAAFDALLSTALRPVDTAVVIDRATGDRCFVFIFEDHLPIVVRLKPEMANDTLRRHIAEIKRTAN